MSLNLELLLTPKEVSELLKVTEGTLKVWRCTKRYPLQYIRVGRAIRYRESAVQAFLQSRTAA